MQSSNSSSFSIKNSLSSEKSSLHCPNDDRIDNNYGMCLMLKSKPDANGNKQTYSQANVDAAIDKVRCGKVGIGLVAAIYGIPISTLRYRIHKLEAASAGASIKLQPKHHVNHSQCSNNGPITLRHSDERMKFHNSPLFGVGSWSAKPTYDPLMAPALPVEFKAPQSRHRTSAALPSTVHPVTNFNIPGSSGGSIGIQFDAATSSSPGIMAETLLSPTHRTMKISDAVAANSPSAFPMVSLSSKVKPLKLPLARYEPRSSSTMQMENFQRHSAFVSRMNVSFNSSIDQVSSWSKETASEDDIIGGNSLKRSYKYRRYDKSTMAKAISSVCEGRMTVCQASCLYDVPYTTLLDKVKRANSYLE